jgi:hypothetical protein
MAGAGSTVAKYKLESRQCTDIHQHFGWWQSLLHRGEFFGS